MPLAGHHKRCPGVPLFAPPSPPLPPPISAHPAGAAKDACGRGGGRQGAEGGGRGRTPKPLPVPEGGKGGRRYSRHPYQSGRRADEKGGGPTGHPTYRPVPGWKGRRGRRVAHDTGATMAVGPQEALPRCARRHPPDHRRWRRQTSTVVGRWKRCGGGTGKEAAGVRHMEVAALSERGKGGGGRENRRGSGRRRCRRSCRSHSQRWKGRRAGRVEHATVAAMAVGPPHTRGPTASRTAASRGPPTVASTQTSTIVRGGGHAAAADQPWAGGRQAHKRGTHGHEQRPGRQSWCFGGGSGGWGGPTMPHGKVGRRGEAGRQ